MSSILELKNFFNSPTATQYLHHIVKTYNKKSFYNSEKLEEILIKIKNKGLYNINLQLSNGWTPLHVAVIANNKEGIHFLLERGATSIPDSSGRLPEHYCGDDSLLAILRSNQLQGQIAEAIDPLKCIEPLLSHYKVEIGSSFYYQAAHDFGLVIEKLLFLQISSLVDSKRQIVDLISDMKRISAEEGFVLQTTSVAHFPRDNFLPMAGNFLLPCYSDRVVKAFERVRSQSFYYQSTSAFSTSHSYFFGAGGSALKLQENSKADYAVQFQKSQHESLPTLRFYLEGGNHYQCTDSKGRTKLFIGEEAFKAAHFDMRLNKVFNELKTELEFYNHFFEKELTEETVQKTLQRMYVEGLIQSKTSNGLTTEKHLQTILMSNLFRGKTWTGENHPLLETAIQEGLFHPLTEFKGSLINQKKIAANYLAQEKLTRVIISLTFAIPEENLFVIPQMAYHLDMFMRPGPCNSMMVQDYKMTRELLENILENEKILKLSHSDLMILERYIATARLLERDFRTLQLKVYEQISLAGFEVLPTPGVFYDVCPGVLNPLHPNEAKTFNINFINAISGYSNVNQEYYYIAAGAQAGDHLGKILMLSFKKFLEQYQPGIHVHFIGEDPQTPGDYQEAMSWFNEVEAQAGPHCMSCETKTSPRSSA